MIKHHCKATIDVLFEAQVNRTPHHIALESDQGALTYKRLNERANQIAHYLKSQSIGSEKVVALHVDRSIEAIIAILAVLKSGGAYLPLNVCDPIERLTFMLQESNAQLLITQSDKILNAIPVSTCQLMTWKKLQIAIQNKSIVTPKKNTEMHNLAYIMYTSGSTGYPKGVEIEHKSIPNMVQTHIKWYELNSSSHALEFSSLHFDASVSEIFTALLSGATLYIPSNDIRPNPDLLADYISKNKITVASIPPVLLTHMKKPADFSLKTLVVAGDTCPKKTMDYWKKYCRIINGYGPTESTVCATLFIYDGTDNRCIGRAIDNIQCYVLNKKLKEVLPNETGELYIGGIGLARGYRNQIKLTQERFIQWTDKKNPNQKISLYRTGDRVRLLNNGCLRYMGRVDFQIKFNGRRLEPEEIENTLNQHPAIQQSLVILRQQNNHSYLVAYVIKKTKKALSKDALKQYLNSKLSAITTPNVFVFLDRFPLLASGKINRRQLPLPVFESMSHKNSAQLTATEHSLRQIWVKVLSLKSNAIVGKRSGFFRLGGTSLQAARLISIIQKDINVKLSVSDIFEHSTLEKLALKLEQLKNEHAKNIILQLKAHPKSLPLSFSQKRLWLSYQAIKAQSPSAYNLTFALDCHGKLKLPAWESALHCLFNRHEVLRTYFPSAGVQRVGYFNLNIERYTLSLKSKNINDAIQRLIDKIARHNFGDLSQLPLVRTALISITKNRFVFLMVFHHIIVDESSIPVLLSELVMLYNNSLEEKPVICHPLPIQYADFSLWQQKKLTEGYYQSAFNYWKNQLHHANTHLNLPWDKARKGEPSSQGQSYVFHLNKVLVKHLKECSKENNVSLFTVLCSSIMVLLYRYTNQEDFTVGVAYGHRPDEKLDTLIGFFVNLLPIRAQLKDEFSFVEVLQQIKSTLLDAYQNSAPLEEIIHHLKLPKPTHAHPLFQVAIVLHDLPELNLNFNELKTSLWNKSLITASDRHSAKFDLAIEMETLSNGDLGIKLEYATDIFLSQTIENFSRYWVTLCKNILKQPKKPISTLLLLSIKEQKKLIEKWGRLGKCYSIKKNILDVFLGQVKKRPNAIAVVDQKERITYRELNEKANQLAHYILQLKNLSKNEHIIAVALHGSLSFVLSILAVLKTGSAYLPLDPDLPINRLKFMLQDASAIVLITKNQYREKFKSIQSPIVALNDLKLVQSLSAQLKSNPQKIIPPQNLAYVIYTSGSTGKPKGVMIEHNNLLHLTKKTLCKITSRDIVGQLCDTTFDVSGAEIWGALLNGAKLVIYSKEILLNIQEISYRLNKDDVSILLLTTAFFISLISSNIKAFRNMKLLCFGGEAFVKIDLLRKLFAEKTVQIKNLINAYGPTENTAISIAHVINKNDVNKNELPIGQATPSTLTYILDNHNQILPPNIPGELYLGGLGVARGYLNRPDLTKRHFIDNPFSKKGNSKLYRTGDWVRYRPNGDIIFLGRMDHQVKVSGYRIELGEIEKSIITQPNVKEAVVVTKIMNEQKYLVAYLTLKSKKMPRNFKKELSNALSKELPDYMVPKAFILLDALPLTNSGKIDRQSLSKMHIKSLKKSTFHPAITKTERSIVLLWKKVLNLKKEISVTDNFFELGGTSLLAMELNYLINQSIKEIKYSTLFSNPTIQSQAALLDNPNGMHDITFDYLKQEATLDPDINLPKQSRFICPMKPKAILLTGATGFLGIFLLESLLNTTEATIYCLIRGKNKTEAYHRLLDNIAQYGLTNQINFARVEIIAGDISQSNLGMSEHDYNQLSQIVELIYHAASTVNFMQSYDALKATNVIGTKHVLRFSMHHTIKPIHYISSAAVFSFSHYLDHNKSALLEKPVEWNETLAKTLPNDLGYTQSKAVSEKLLWEARQRGFPISIYRVGFILCHSKTGIGNPKQIWSRFIRDCLSLGHYPTLVNVKEEFLTVDYAAQAITQIAQQKTSLGKIFHIMPSPEHNLTTDDLFQQINKHTNRLKPESYIDWLKRLKFFIRSGHSSELKPLLPLFTEKIQNELTLLELYQHSLHFSIKNTQEALIKINIIDDAIDSDIIRRYLAYLTK